MTLRNHCRGFTLIEVLIVVVVIAVLAALIIPRMLGSIEIANLGEAYMRVGALCRAQQRRMDRGSFSPTAVSCYEPPADCGSIKLNLLDLKEIPQKNFRYRCAVTTSPDSGYCEATRWIDGAASTAKILQYFVNEADPSIVGKWYCGETGTPGYVTEDTGAVGYNESGTGCRPNF